LPRSLDLAREKGRENYARGSERAAARGTTISKERPPEYREKQNASRAGRTVSVNGKQRCSPNLSQQQRRSPWRWISG
jgi:hypothetical protein